MSGCTELSHDFSLVQAEKAAFDEAEKKKLEEVCKHLLFRITLALCGLVRYI
jgi:hypothetical protein